MNSFSVYLQDSVLRLLAKDAFGKCIPAVVLKMTHFKYEAAHDVRLFQ